MIKRNLVIKNKMGLHARPSADFVKIASRYDADVTIGKDGIEVNGKSIMGLLMLAAEKGSKIILKTNGKDEKKMAQELSGFLEGKCNED